MQVVKFEKQDTTALIYMCNGPNTHEPVFAEQLMSCFDSVLEDEQVSSMVLTGTDDKNFSQGIDTQWLKQQMAEGEFDEVSSFLHDMNKIFKTLLTFPVPVIAAINGHAFGNGALLACACDFRLMQKDKGFFCFPEVDIDIPFLPGMIKLARKAIPEHLFNHMTLTGSRIDAAVLEKENVIKKACTDKNNLFKETLEFAKIFQKQRTIFSELKKRMHKNIIDTMETEDVTKIDSMDLF